MFSAQNLEDQDSERQSLLQGRGGGSMPSDIVNVTWSNIVLETEYHAPRYAFVAYSSI